MRSLTSSSGIVVGSAHGIRGGLGQVVLVCAAILTPACAQAAMVFSALETGGSVIFTGAGSFDTTGLVASTPLPLPASVRANQFFLVGPAAPTQYQFYEILNAGPAIIGPGTLTMNATSGSGDLFGLNYIDTPQLFVAVPSNYVSGTALAGTATYSGQTLASLGLAEGTYSWPAGANAVTLTVAVSAVPEPSTLVLLPVLGAVGFIRRRRQA